jgi:hypothetical protein
MMEISVSDTGTGIPEELRDDIFRPWVRANPGDARSQRGTGLGLAIAKMIIELHRGTISVASGEKGGSVFTFTLPLWSGGIPEEPEKMIIESIHGRDPDQAKWLQMSFGGIREKRSSRGNRFSHCRRDPVNIRLLRNFLEMRNMCREDGL